MDEDARTGSRIRDRVEGSEGPQEGRRDFLRYTGLSAFGALVGMTIPFERNLPSGIVPVALAQDGEQALPGKQGLKLLIKLRKQAKIRRLRGKLHWEGDLDEMRS